MLEGLFDPRVIVRHAPVDRANVERLTERERAAIERSSPKRQQEFATGRVLAREALAALGITGFDLVNGEDRCPVWPEGIAGTVSHSDTLAVVAVARMAEVGTVGVDVEHRAVLERRLWRLTMLPDEIAYLDAVPEDTRGVLALAIFSLKESLYKAQYPRSREYMGFSALAVELTPNEETPRDRGTSRCIFQRDVGPFPRGFVAHGRYGRAPSGELVSAVTIPV